MTDQALLPCPFCGGKARIFNTSGERYCVEGVVGCTDCCAEIGSDDSTDKAVDAWNKRYPIPASLS